MMKHLLILGICCLPLSTVCAEETFWNAFRGHDGTGTAPDANVPLTFGENENLLWKVPIAGKAWSSPVVWENQIWFTNADKTGKELWAVCVDLETGDTLHNVKVFAPEEPQYCHDMNSYATPTPVVEAGRVYVHFGVHGTACLDTKSGKILWSRADLECDHFRGPASSPIVHENLLVLLFDGHDVQYVVTLDKNTGKTIWKHNRAFNFDTNNGDRKKAYGTAAVITVNGQQQLIAPAAVATEAFNPKTGKLLWTVKHGGMNASARPLYADGRLFITNGMGRMVAVNPDGSGDITKENLLWESGKTVPKKASPLLIGDHLFMISDTGVATCVEAKSGEIVWAHRFDAAYAASPIFVNGRIYLFDLEGNIPVIAPSTEFKLLATNKVEGGFMATPAVAKDSLILRTKTHLYRVGKKE